jgi:hypothetical protein
MGVFSGASFATNGTNSSNFAVQGPLQNIVEPTSGFAHFDIPTEGCGAGCITSGIATNAMSGSYQFLSWGTLNESLEYVDTETGLLHDIQNTRWLYGEATSLDYLNTRTGTASYAGQIYGDFAESGVTQYNVVTGGIGLSFNFSDDTLSGEGYFALGGTPQESFSIAGALVSSGGHQFLQASLTGQQDAINTGGLLGSFYGPEADEIGGAIWYFGHDAAIGGVFVAQPGTFVMPEIENNTDFARITSNNGSYSIYHSDAVIISGVVSIPGDEGMGTVSETFGNSGYSYSSWGKWTGNVSAPVGYTQGGHWVSVDTTPASVVQNHTGNATYSGNIRGDFVSDGGVRDDARGLININADFSNQSVSGQMQFGHDCGSGSGPSGCNIISGVASFNEVINDYGGAGFGDHTNPQTSGSGVVGIFGGPNAEEIGGNAWLEDNGGMYNGVFIAGQ